MKKLAVAFFILLLTSCGEYKAIMAESTENFKMSKLYFQDHNKEIVTVIIDGMQQNLLFDTGAGATVISHPKFQIDEKKRIRDRIIYGFDKKSKIKSFSYSSDSLYSSIFKVTKKYLFIVPDKLSICTTAKQYDGILGNFFESDMILEINYEQGYLQFLEQLPDTELIELEAKFNSYTGKFSIQMEVNGQKDFFIFDTGNNSMTLLNKNIFTEVNNKIYTIEVLGQSVGKSEINMKIDVFQEKLKMGNNLVFYYSLGIDKSSDRSILSKSLIERFNWYVDKKNNKVFCKPINKEKFEIKTDLSKRNNRMYANEFDGKLKIYYKNFESKIAIGDQITSVNNQQVTSENICQIRQLLNETEDWNTLNIQIASKTN